MQGDKFLKGYSRKTFKPLIAYNYLNKCLAAYESDLVDGTIPYDHFVRKINFIHREFSFIASRITGSEKVSLNQYPATEAHIDSFATCLIRHQRYDEAIKLLKLNIEMHPSSTDAYESLAKAYSSSGDKRMAGIYANRSVALSRKESMKGSE